MNVEIIFTYKDLTGGGIRKLANSVKDLFKGVNQELTTTRERFDNLGKAIHGLNENFKQASNAAGKSLSKIGNDATEAAKKITSMNTALQNKTHSGDAPKKENKAKKYIGKYAELSTYGEMAIGGLASAGMAVGNFALSQGKEVLQSGMQASTTKHNYKSMAGEQQGEALYSGVQQYAGATMYGNGLYKNAEDMLKLGVAADQIMPAMRMLGEVAAGNQEKMDMLSIAFAETAGTGKLTEDALSKFKDAGFDPLADIAKKTGIGYDELEKKMKSGLVSASMVQQSLSEVTGAGGQFNGALASAAQTPQGKMTDMQNSVAESKMSLGAALEPAISGLMTALQPFIQRLPALFTQLQPIIETILNSFGALLPSIMDYASALFEMLKPIFNLLAGEAMTRLIGGIIDIGTAIMQFLTPVIEIIVDELGSFLEVVSVIVGFIGKLLKGVGGFVSGLWKSSKAADDMHSRQKTRAAVASTVFDVATGALPFNDKPAIAKAATPIKAATPTAAPKVSSKWYEQQMNKAAPAPHATPVAPAAPQATAPITGGGQKIIRINFRNVVEKMYNTVADTTGLVNNIEPRLDEAINRILAGVS